MFKRLAVLFLVTAAALSVSTPARASTVTLDSLVCSWEPQVVNCAAHASGGTGSYVYHWRLWFGYAQQGNSFTTYFTNETGFRCPYDEVVRVTVTAEDSAGVKSTSKGVTVICN